MAHDLEQAFAADGKRETEKARCGAVRESDVARGVDCDERLDHLVEERLELVGPVASRVVECGFEPLCFLRQAASGLSRTRRSRIKAQASTAMAPRRRDVQEVRRVHTLAMQRYPTPRTVSS